MTELYQTYLSEAIKELVAEIHRKGFVYFHHGLLPRVLEAGKIHGFSKDVLSKCWNIIAAIYKLNGAPKRAIDCQRKAVVLAPQNVSFQINLMNLQLAIGAFHDAFVNVDKAMNIEPDNMQLITLRQRIQDDINYDSEPVYSADNFIWQLNEWLAEEKFESVINAVLETNMNNVDQLKCLARAFGAVSHNANYLKIWDSIIARNKNVEPDLADWFYCPVDLHENQQIKEIFDKVNLI